MQDSELIFGCIKQDRKSQKILFDRFYNDMLSVCLRYSKDQDEAQEILQKGFIKVFSKIGLFNGHGTLKGWIHSIMIRTAIDHYRWAKRELRVVVEENEGYDEPQDAIIEADIAAEEILNLIQRLPFIQRTVFNLFALEGYSHKEISKEVGITEGTSKWHLCEARKNLRKMLTVLYPERVKNYA